MRIPLSIQLGYTKCTLNKQERSDTWIFANNFTFLVEQNLTVVCKHYRLGAEVLAVDNRVDLGKG